MMVNGLLLVLDFFFQSSSNNSHSSFAYDRLHTKTLYSWDLVTTDDFGEGKNVPFALFLQSTLFDKFNRNELNLMTALNTNDCHLKKHAVLQLAESFTVQNYIATT